jgi:ABC-type phosphate transport system substrate-binding protein
MRIWQLIIFIQIVVLLHPPALAASVDANVGSRVAVISSSSFNPGVISANTLRAIFVMNQTKWSDGTPVKVYVFSDSNPTHEVFSKEVLRFFPRQLRRAWDRQVFAGLGQYPEQVSSAQEMLAKVKATPGSVGYLLLQEVNQDVRILQISQ